MWSRPDTRKKLFDELNSKGYTNTLLESLKSLIRAEDSDLFDVLSHFAFDTTPLKRSERVDLAESSFEGYSSKQRELINAISERYRQSGESELEEEKISDHIILNYGSIEDGKQNLGDLKDISDLYMGFQKHLYEKNDN